MNYNCLKLYNRKNFVKIFIQIPCLLLYVKRIGGDV
jgi:hypothetical protein